MNTRVSMLVLLLGISLTGLAHAALPKLTPDAQADEVLDLPGLDFEIPFRQFSGYLDAGEDNFYHYWFVESYVDPTTAPLLLWLNGGPGCSSMDGFLNELGPFHINDDGKTLYNNTYSWNTFANMIFLESPACVGYSYNKQNNCSASDDSTSQHNYNALKSFFTKFPSYLANDFFVTGESYGGIYVPTLTVRIIEGNSNYPINLKGFAVGNGMLSWEDNDNSIIFFANYHGLLGQILWDRLVSECCDNDIPTQEDCHFYHSQWPVCMAAVADANLIIYSEGLNMYNLYAPCEHPNSTYSTGLSRYHADMRNVHTYLRKAGYSSKAMDPPCTDDTIISAYLNDPSVRKAIHIEDSLPEWEMCNNDVNIHFETQYASMQEQYTKIQAAGVRGLVYNGDVDMACNFIGDQWFTEGLGFKETERRRMWHSGGQVGGFVKRFELLDLLTVRGSGHMVPQDKPGPSLDMITSFVFNTGYD